MKKTMLIVALAALVLGLTASALAHNGDIEEASWGNIKAKYRDRK